MHWRKCLILLVTVVAWNGICFASLPVRAAIQTPQSENGVDGDVVTENHSDAAPDATVDTAIDDPVGPVDFKRDVFPILESRCFDCHAGESPDSGLRLDLHRELLGYSAGEAWIVPGDSHASRLIDIVRSDSEDERMPPDGDDPLSKEEIAILSAWIDQGMKWDDELLPPAKLDSDHWAFQPIAPQVVPVSDDSEWVKTPVDAFILKSQTDRGLVHSREASARTLVRRLYLDLIGLPPTPEQVNAYLDDDTPRAYEDLVDQLLASPHYGERWGRYWLDLARWAESQGYQHDVIRPYAWRYRDYVIDSFNKDKSYARFIKEQLAGDELQPYSDENLVAADR